MYQANNLERKVLITPKEVIFHAPTTHTIDERSILNSIIIAESRFVAPCLGYDFYNALLDQKNVVVTTGNQSTLLTKINAFETSIGETTLTTVDSIPEGTIINAWEEMATAAYKTLWKDHLWKYIAECVECVLIVPTWLQHTAQGQQKNNPEVIGSNGQNSVTGDLKDVRYKEDKFLQDRIDPLRAAMEYYLCKNTTSFPLYTCKDTSADGVSLSRKSPIIHGVYDDEDVNTDCI